MALSTQSLAGLMPSAETMATWRTVADARLWCQFPEAEWKKIAEKLGDESLNDMMVVGAIGVTDIKTAIAQVELNPILKGKLNLLYNAILHRFGQSTVNLWAVPAVANDTPAAAGSAYPGQPPVAPPPVAMVKLNLVLDQTWDQAVPMLSEEKLAEARAAYRRLMGDPPIDAVQVTDAQLTALKWALDCRRAPYVDMAIWGPFGDRKARKLFFTAKIQMADGSWRSIEIPGPDCLDTWEECWAVFKTALLMLQVANLSTIDLYAALFRERCKRYPRSWQYCVQADMRCRSELFAAERRNQEAFHMASPNFSSFNPEKPWNTVIKACAKDAEFWERELKEPALKHELAGGAPSYVDRQPGTIAPDASGEKRKRPPPPPPPATAPPPPPPPRDDGRKKKKGAQNDGKTKDGRFLTDTHGSQICFSWNRAKDGCTDGQCPNKRAHVCEFCRQPHRAVICRPNWKPPGKRS